MTDTDWRESAICKQVDPQLWFPEKAGDNGEEAKRVCRRCPVRSDCLESALADDEQYGIWGGASPDERRKIRARRGMVTQRAYRVPTSEILRLHGAGWNAKNIAGALRLHADVVRREIRVAAGAPAVAPPTVEPPVGVVRRRQALATMGYRMTDIATHMGVTQRVLTHSIARGRLTGELWDRWCATYLALSAEEGPSPHAAKLALRHGWLPPTAWTADTIDDPDAVPATEGAAA